jgi:hypothetical protein
VSLSVTLLQLCLVVLKETVSSPFWAALDLNDSNAFDCEEKLGNASKFFSTGIGENDHLISDIDKFGQKMTISLKNFATESK